MSFLYLSTLETPRLILRRMTMRDARDIYEYGKDSQVARYVLWDPYRSVSEARNYIRYMIRKYHTGEPSSWCIEWKQTGEVIGTIGYMWIQEEHGSAEVGYSLSRPFWNRGIMTEALRAVLEFSFYELRLNRIEAQHESKNPASGKVMQKCGMKHEGTLRQRLMNKGKYVDTELYSILRSEMK